MRGTGDVEAEARVLTSEAGRALLAEVSAVLVPGPADLTRWRKEAPADLVSAALRLAACRRRGAAKFSRADAMWFEATGLEQATAEPVSRHKARRFEGGLVVDLCSGIGGDALALASRATVLAVDLDAGMNRRTRWNAEVYGVAERVAPIRARAEAFPIPRGAWIHIDPDRRAGLGQERTRAGTCATTCRGPDSCRDCPRWPRGGRSSSARRATSTATSPGPDSRSSWSAWGASARRPPSGSATSPPAVEGRPVSPTSSTWTDRSAPDTPPIAPTGPSRWIFDPDPALIRSGLLDSFATEHGLSRCVAGIDFLTGPDRVASPFLAEFEVLEVLPLDLKALRRLVVARGLGPLEIKTKGVDIRPETLRDQLRPPGPNPATLLLMGGRGPSRAVLARRVGLTDRFRRSDL